jgi:hypothetical protein
MGTPLVRHSGDHAQPIIRKVKFSGTTALVRGQAVFYDRDYGTATTADPDRDWIVEAASAGNYHNFAGVAIAAYAAKSSGQIIDIYVPPSFCEVYTAETSVTLGELLYINSSGYFTKVAGANVLAARAMQTISAAGLIFVQLIQPDTVLGAIGSASDLRLPSPAIWQGCPWDLIQKRVIDGAVYYNDFDGNYNYTLAANQTITKLDGGVCACTAGTAGTTLSQVTGENGIIHLESTTDDEDVIVSCFGNSVAGAYSGYGQALFAAGKQTWMEACISQVNVTNSKANLFCGFAEEGLVATTTLLTASDAMADKDYVGFQRVFADGDALDTVFNTESGATSPITVGSDAVTVAAGTMIKIGLYSDGTTVRFYSAGVELDDTVLVAATDFPINQHMCFYLGIMLGHGDTFSAECDWVKIAQTF